MEAVCVAVVERLVHDSLVTLAVEAEGLETPGHAPEHARAKRPYKRTPKLLAECTVEDEVDGAVEGDQKVAEVGKDAPTFRHLNFGHVNRVGHVVDEGGHLADDEHHDHEHQHDSDVVFTRLTYVHHVFALLL